MGSLGWAWAGCITIQTGQSGGHGPRAKRRAGRRVRVPGTEPLARRWTHTREDRKWQGVDGGRGQLQGRSWVLNPRTAK